METPAAAAAAKVTIAGEDEHECGDDSVNSIATVAMTPLSVIASTCLQVTLSSSVDGDKPLAFNLLGAAVTATAGMLMAVYLVTVRSCSSTRSESKSETAAGTNKIAALAIVLEELRPIDEKERKRVARMMLRCLWFSLSYMNTGVLCRVLRQQLELSTGVNTAVTVVVWIVFVWSSFGAPLPRFNRWLKMAGSAFSVTFPILLMAAYASLFFLRSL